MRAFFQKHWEDIGNGDGYWLYYVYTRSWYWPLKRYYGDYRSRETAKSVVRRLNRKRR